MTEIHTLIVGLDAYDPRVFERLSASGRLPNLTRYAEMGGYSRFQVANPPQSEVSWTSIATGLNPGGHGIFDFVHRDPRTYAPYVSLLPTQKGLGGTQFVPPHSAVTIFEQATRQGYPATALWWPATFPARPELAVRTIPGLGTPDILGRMGVGTLFCSDAGLVDGGGKIPVVPLEAVGSARYRGSLTGPTGKTLRGSRESSIQMELQLRDEGSAYLTLGGEALDLQLGTWSPILEIAFDLGRWVKAHAVTRVILTQVHPHIQLYVMPLQLHPLHSPWRYGSPGSFVKQMWQEHGPFLTLGMPQDTTALEDGCITDDQFMALCDSIFETRRRVLMNLLPGFREGLLAAVFDSLDRIQHAFFRDRPDIVERWYVKLDALVGEVAQRLADRGMDGVRLVILSDHGITRFEHKVHLNRWLLECGYLAKVPHGESNDLSAVDWSRTRAYAVGLNSLYLNVAGREAQGCVGPEQVEGLTRRLQDELQAWRGPDGAPVVRRAWRREETFTGPLAEYGPDVVVGYAPGYRASAETGLGKWKETVIEPNQDRWNSDHCVDHRTVPGVLFANCGLHGYTNPSYRDIPALTLGMELSQSDAPPPRELGQEDMEAIEERLKGLGYL